jgi:3-hydroxybutyryl-CoA dehydrogenase
VTVRTVGVVGAGTMGAGIAQVACLGGFHARLFDPVEGALAAGAERLRADLLRGVDRGRWTRGQAEAASARLLAVPGLDHLAPCELVIEAAPEDLELKRSLFARLAECCGADAILATNTSSLSVSEIAVGVTGPERVCGMHFFNPPALMRLVEVVSGRETSERTAKVASEAAAAMGREPIRCADSVGFVVNRCNRPFTLEALRILDQGIATHRLIDRVVRERGGYPMGPFELMDLVGIDVNLEVARSFFRQRPEPRWRPHPIQEQMVAAGRLGRKSGRGFYEYDEGGRVADGDEGGSELPPELSSRILDRVLAQLVNEAHFAVEEDVAAADDIDRAMRLGLNHPRGPFEWCEEMGPARVLGVLERLASEADPDVCAPAPRLRAVAAA